MKHSKTCVVRCFIILCLLSGFAGTLSAADPAPVPPDFTQGGKKDDSHDWLLGPTGARGWMFFRHEDQTATSRQILITAVETGSPADGVLRVNDVILGVAGQPFADDARKSLARAITVAEEKTGMLRLTCWREGKTANVDLKLAVLGAYSDTAPYGCPKSKAIFEQGCRFIAKQGLKNVAISMDFNALALLASGNKEYLPMLADYAKKVAASMRQGMGCWDQAYGNLFLAEYVLATADKPMLSELKRTTMEAVNAQCMNGMWGHNPPLPDGHSEGYGGMNQVGLPMTISLVLARKAGVTDPAVGKAIDKSIRLLRWFVNKGAIPYGDHAPWPSHEDNGKCSSAAVLFDLLGDREAAAFFSWMAVAAYDEREHGHCGNLWNMLWALPGASRSGPLATGAYLKEQSWYYELARNWKGGLVYQPIEKGDENNNYTDWDLTGAYLLSYGLPLKSLYVMGKKPSVAPSLKADEVSEVIAAGRDCYPVGDNNGYYKRTTDELLAGLSSWSPAMRKRSAEALGKREGDFLPTLQKMLAGSDCYGRYGACEALGCLGARADAVAPQLRALLKDPDPWVESLACNAIAHLGPDARKASETDLLMLAARKNPADPRKMAHRAVANALFEPFPGTRTPTVLNNSLDGVDRRLLYPAMCSLLQNDDSVPRGALGPYLSKLTDRDLAVMLPAVVKAVEIMSPSDEMWGDDIRIAGLDLLSSRHIREGMDLCVSTLEWRWGLQWEKRMEYLMRYGSHAKIVLPKLRAKRPDKWPEGAVKFDKYITDIEAETDTPKLISLKDFIAKASASTDASNHPKKGTP
ncbi:MAG: DUF6288 domain-containing protein [Verrucomicrobia bacterium]|nr:DUF6288 domain-containing protein [Verrucomicrobiota bacterium]